MEPIDQTVLRARIRAAVAKEAMGMSASDVHDLVMAPWLELRDALRTA